MKRLGFVLAFLASLLGSAFAQGGMMPGPGTAHSVAAPYVGPGDVVSGAFVFYSCYRAYNQAFAATQGAICDLVDTATGASTCTLKVGTNGFADTSSNVCVGNTVSVTTFCTITNASCKVNKQYDQTSNGRHVTQATLANMMPFTLSPAGVSAHPVITPTGAAEALAGPNITQAQPFFFWAVSIRTGNTTVYSEMIGSVGVPPGLLYDHSANNVSLYASLAPTTGATDNAWHAIGGLVNTTSSQLWVDNAGSGAISTGASAFSANPISVGNFSGTAMTGSLGETAMWPSDISASISSLTSNARGAANGYNF